MTDSTPSGTATATEVDTAEVQGNLAGFNQDHQRLLYVTFPDAATGRALLGVLRPQLATAEDVLAVNRLYKQIVARRHASRKTIEATWVNLLLSATGLRLLDAPGLDSLPAEFLSTMASQADALGDKDRSAPTNWVAPFASGAEIHALVIVAADDAADLEVRCQETETLITGSGATVVGRQDGNVRPGPQRGHEHFGFKDGISQPSIKGLTRSSKGGDEVPAGEFIIGYPDALGEISGQAGTPPAAPPTVDQYGNQIPSTPPVVPALPDWTRNGSFVVYRRLQQDVQGFAAFAQQTAGTWGVGADAVGAKLVGRWASGAPMERVPGVPGDVDPSAADRSIADRRVLNDNRINNFGYADDPDGALVPRSAHIRKTYPRDQVNPGEADAERHRILRRGIPYGPEVQVGEPAYPGAGPVLDGQDRGLLFLCYQASIARGFAFIQRQWVNAADFPTAGDGVDPIISQSQDGAVTTIPPHGGLALQRWVVTTGGGYYFSPSISAVDLLSGAAPATSAAG